MTLINLFVAVLLSLFSTVIMSYISMATPIGPWIETTLVLAGLLIFTLLKSWYTEENRTKALVLTTAAGGIGGILATGMGFSFPTLFFIDNAGFSSLMSNPFQFALVVSGLALAAGSLGLLAAHLFEHTLIIKQQLPFPIGELIYKTISAVDSLKKAFMLAVGFIGTQVALFIRSTSAFLSQPLQLLPQLSYGVITLPRIVVQTDTFPMFWAIGFVTGEVIALPLLAGIIARTFCIEPLFRVYPAIMNFFEQQGLGLLAWFSPNSALMAYNDFTLAFCGGIVVYGAALGFLGLPSLLIGGIKKLFHASTVEKKEEYLKKMPWLLAGATLAFNIAALTACGFSALSQLYLLLFTFVCAYQMALIAGKIGLAPLGRFATFVMVPGMLIFGYNPLQVTVVAAYVEIAGGVACDALFGRKMAQLASVSQRSIERYQWLGLVVSALSVGLIFWLFINHFGIGEQPGAFAAARGQNRALLIDVKMFDPVVLGLGFIFGYLLKYVKVNPILMLGGILMPINYSVLLILGGMSTYLVQDKEKYYPFWSGVFAANSLWMLLKAFLP